MKAKILSLLHKIIYIFGYLFQKKRNYSFQIHVEFSLEEKILFLKFIEIQMLLRLVHLSIRLLQNNNKTSWKKWGNDRRNLKSDYHVSSSVARIRKLLRKFWGLSQHVVLFTKSERSKFHTGYPNWVWFKILWQLLWWVFYSLCKFVKTLEWQTIFSEF